MSNFIKFIFIILIIGIVIFLSVLLLKSRDSEEGKKTSKIIEDEEVFQDDIRLSVAALDTLNPILSNNRNVYEFSKIIYEPLIALDMNYRKEYALAERIEQKNETQYIVYLRDAKWHDGSNVKSEDFHFTIKMINATDSIYKDNIEKIASIKSINDYSFIITLKSAQPYFEYYLTFPLMKKISEKTFKDKSKIPIGSGIYKFEETKNNILSYELFEDYWNKEAVEKTSFKKVYIYKYKTIGEVYNAFKAGNIDIINASNNKYVDQIGTFGYVDMEYKARDFHFLAFNTKRINKNIRRAISFALDKDKIVTELGKGVTKSSFPTDFGHWTYPQTHKLEFNLDEAKKILNENNYQLKSGKWIDKKTKKNLTYSILVNGDNKTQVKTAEKISQALNKFGIETKLNTKYGNTYYSAVKTRNYDLAIIGRRSDFTPSLEVFFGDNNYFQYNHNEIKSLMIKARTETDESKFLEIYNKIYNIYLEDIPFIGVYRNTKRLITSLGLHMDSIPNSYNMLYNIENWYRK